MTATPAPEWRQHPMTDAQAKLLRRLGATVIPTMTKGEASDKIEARIRDLSTATVETVECPVCGAIPGAMCRRPAGAFRGPHRHRQSAARKARS
jgi:hypothetical protein